MLCLTIRYIFMRYHLQVRAPRCVCFGGWGVAVSHSRASCSRNIGNISPKSKEFWYSFFSAADSISKNRSVRRSVGRFVGRSVTLSKNVKTVYGVLKSNLVMLVEIF